MMGNKAPPIAQRNSCATPNIVLSFGGNNSVAMINPVILTPCEIKKFKMLYDELVQKM